MTQEQKNKEFKAITNKMFDMYSKKNELYGDSFNQLMYEWGLVAGVVPIDNKLRRIKSIIKGTEVKYESLEDSLYDLFYGVLITSTVYDYVLYVGNIRTNLGYTVSINKDNEIHLFDNMQKYNEKDNK